MSFLPARTCVHHPIPVSRTSARQNADVRSLDTNSLILIGFWCALRWYFYASGGEKIPKKMSLVSALTCVHHPMSLLRTSARESDHFQHSATNTNVRQCCIMACGWFFRRTCFNYVPTLVHPLVLQLREYPLKPVTFTLCHFYLRNICPLFFSSQLSSFSAACFSASIQSPPDASLCGVVSNS